LTAALKPRRNTHGGVRSGKRGGRKLNDFVFARM
jgi:hypothetical protein